MEVSLFLKAMVCQPTACRCSEINQKTTDEFLTLFDRMKNMEATAGEMSTRLRNVEESIEEIKSLLIRSSNDSPKPEPSSL